MLIVFTLSTKDDAPCVLKMKTSSTETELSFLVDTGASANVISYSVLTKSQREKIQPDNVEIAGITNNVIPVLGKIQMEYRLGPHCIVGNAYVVDDRQLNLKTDGILSRKFMLNNQLSFCDINTKIEFKGRKYPLLPIASEKEENSERQQVVTQKAQTDMQTRERQLSKKRTSNEIYITERITLQPFSLTLISAKCAKTASGQCIYQPAVPDIQANEVTFATSIHELENSRTIQICAINASPSPQKLRKYVTLGTLTEFEKDNIKEVLNEEDEEEKLEEIKEEIMAFSEEVTEMLNGDKGSKLIDEIPRASDITTIADLAQLEDEQQRQMQELIAEFSDLAYQPGQKLSYTPIAKAKIDTKPHEPFRAKQYFIPYSVRADLAKEIKNLLDAGIIKKTENSFYNSPCLFLTRKTNGQVKNRLVLDLRRLNQIVKPIAQEFPNMFDMITMAGQNDWYSSLDLVRAYNQVLLDKDSQELTSFNIFGQTYCYQRLVFGLTTAPQIFQNIINKLFLDQMGSNISCYLDDLLIFSKGSFSEHITKVREALGILRKAGLKINVGKCSWAKKEINYLGFKINKHSITPLPEKIELIKNWPRPQSAKQIQKFLGLVGFFRSFVPQFAETAKPLTQLLKKKIRFKWTAWCEAAFTTLKKQLCRKSELSFPLLHQNAPPLKVFCDASYYSVGAVLAQEQLNPVTKQVEILPIAFASRTLNSTEQNYETYRKELLAVCYSCKTFEKYLFGKKFELYSDHKPLTYIFTSKNLKGVFIRYALYLSQFDFEIRFIKGTENKAADSLSRLLIENGKLRYAPETADDGKQYESYQEFIKTWEKKQKEADLTIIEEMTSTKQQSDQNNFETDVEKNKRKSTLNQDEMRPGNYESRVNEEKMWHSLRKQLGELEKQLKTESNRKGGPKNLKVLEEKYLQLLLKADAFQTQDEESKKHRRLFVVEINNQLEFLDKLHSSSKENVQDMKSSSTDRHFENALEETSTDEAFEDHIDSSEQDEESTESESEDKNSLSGEEVDNESNDLNKTTRQDDPGTKLVKKNQGFQTKTKQEEETQKRDSGCDTDNSESTADSEEVYTSTEIESEDSQSDHEWESTEDSEVSLKTFDKEDEMPIIRHEALPTEVQQKKIWERDLQIRREDILKEQHNDIKIQNISAGIDNEHPKMSLIYAKDEDGLVYKLNKEGLPKLLIPESLETEVTTRYHESVFTGHPGINKLTALMKRRIHFNNMDKKIRDILRQCDVCAKTKASNRPTIAKMKLYPLETVPFNVIHCDFAGPITSQNDPKGYKYALLITCRFSHWTEIYPMKEISAENLIRIFIQKFIPNHGLPRKIVTDGGSQFTSGAFKDLCEKFNVELAKTTAYRPQSNAMAEKSVKITKTFLASLIQSHPGILWYKFIPYVKICVRSQVNEATKFSPFQMIYNREMLLPTESQLIFSKYRLAEDNEIDLNIALWKAAWEKAANNMAEYQAKTKERYDRKSRPHKLVKGQKVFIRNAAQKPHLAKIYQPKYSGPYKLLGVNDTTAYVETGPNKVTKVHVDRIKGITSTQEKKDNTSCAEKRKAQDDLIETEEIRDSSEACESPVSIEPFSDGPADENENELIHKNLIDAVTRAEEKRREHRIERQKAGERLLEQKQRERAVENDPEHGKTITIQAEIHQEQPSTDKNEDLKRTNQDTDKEKTIQKEYSSKTSKGKPTKTHNTKAKPAATRLAIDATKRKRGRPRKIPTVIRPTTDLPIDPCKISIKETIKPKPLSVKANKKRKAEDCSETKQRSKSRKSETQRTVENSAENTEEKNIYDDQRESKRVQSENTEEIDKSPVENYKDKLRRKKVKGDPTSRLVTLPKQKKRKARKRKVKRTYKKRKICLLRTNKNK